MFKKDRIYPSVCMLFQNAAANIVNILAHGFFGGAKESDFFFFYTITHTHLKSNTIYCLNSYFIE